MIFRRSRARGRQAATSLPARRAHRIRTRILLAGLAVIPLVFLAVFFVLPVAGMIWRGLHQDGTWQWGEIIAVLTRERTLRVLRFTVVTAAAATGVTVFLGVPAAYSLYRLQWPGVTLVRSVLVMPFVMPTVAVGIAFRTLLVDSGPLGFLHLDGTRTAIIAAMVFFNLSVVIRTVGSLWAGLDARAEQAAATLGASPFTVFWTVTLRRLLPALVSSTVVVFLFCSTAFGIVLLLGGVRYSTIETEIYTLTTSYLDLTGAAVLSIVQFVLVLFLLAVVRFLPQRNGGAATTVSGVRTPQRSDLAVLAVTGMVFLGVLAPIVTMVFRSLQTDSGLGWDNYLLLWQENASPALLTTVGDAFRNSWVIAVDATLIAVTLGLLVSLLVTLPVRSARARRVRAVIDGVFMLPLGISAVTVGFGFLITLDRPPIDLRSSLVLIPIAQAMVALPLVVRSLVPVLRSVDQRVRYAAEVLGASPLRAWAVATLPILWRPLAATTGLAMAVSLGEFGATAFLSRSDNPTLPVVIYSLSGSPGPHNFGMALAAATLLSLATVVLMAGVERLGSGKVGGF